MLFRNVDVNLKHYKLSNHRMLKCEGTKLLKITCAFRERDVNSFENFSQFNLKISHIDVNF
jgi:hypothetical protein